MPIASRPPDAWTTTKRWRFALKPASWPKLLVPTLLGMALGLGHGTTPQAAALLVASALAALFVAGDTLFIVCLNDVGDEPVDRIKRTRFPDAGGMKTLPDGVLPRAALIRAGLGGGFLALFAGAAAAAWRAELAPLLLTAAALLCFVAYTLPPLKLNYRGGGELLEALGVGWLLPLTVASFFGARSPALAAAPSLLVYVALSAASAVASGLSDEASDREGGKRTVVTLLGNGVARGAIALALLAGAGLAGASLGPPWRVVVAAAILLGLAWCAPPLHLARTGAFASQRVLKGRLHAVIWITGLLLAAAVLSSEP